MPSILLTPPLIEPLSLAHMKDYLRVSHVDDDVLIAALIANARAHVEAQTRRALITQTWRCSLDGWPACGRIEFLPAPLQDLVAVRVYDSGEAATIDLDTFIIHSVSVPGAISFAPWSVRVPERRYGGIELDFIAGHGDAPADVPGPLIFAIRLLVAHWYENRGIVGPAAHANPLPMTAAELIAPYRVLSL